MLIDLPTRLVKSIFSLAPARGHSDALSSIFSRAAARDGPKRVSAARTPIAAARPIVALPVVASDVLPTDRRANAAVPGDVAPGPARATKLSAFSETYPHR